MENSAGLLVTKTQNKNKNKANTKNKNLRFFTFLQFLEIFEYKTLLSFSSIFYLFDYHKRKSLLATKRTK